MYPPTREGVKSSAIKNQARSSFTRVIFVNPNGDGYRVSDDGIAASIGNCFCPGVQSVDDYISSSQSLSPIISDVAQAIADDKLKTAAAGEIQRRLKASGR
jgi:hypothetical protein